MISCRTCRKVFSTWYLYQRHIKKCENYPIYLHSEKIEDFPECFECSIGFCPPKLFENKAALMKHIEEDILENGYIPRTTLTPEYSSVLRKLKYLKLKNNLVCYDCKKKFKQISVFVDHIKDIYLKERALVLSSYCANTNSEKRPKKNS